MKVVLNQGYLLSALLYHMVLEQHITDTHVNREGHTMYKSHQMIGYIDSVVLRGDRKLKEIKKDW